MAIFIANSLTRTKEEFVPLSPPRVTIYTCGVTVYDDCHIGHARSLYIFEVIRRYLAFRGFEVRFVRNITDIDDKIINRANELKEDWQSLVDRYIQRYYEDIAALGINRADAEPRATETIPEMIAYIRRLIEKGYAYEAGGDVYFQVRKFRGYGKLSGQSIDQMEKGVRIEPSQYKRDHLDFALWKKSKEAEPGWESPWGKGRPGWHIECSVMSQKFLGVDTLDIHAGGRDLIFPHHENEIAQAEALTEKPFAKYWIHHGLLTTDGQKMSKSLGNFVTIKDFLARHRHPDFLKLFFLAGHYTHPLDYTEEKIKEAQKQKKVFNAFFQRAGLLDEDKTLPPLAEAAKEKIDGIYQQCLRVMDNDFNTPQALGYFFELVDTASGLEAAAFDYSRSRLAELFRVFNLEVLPPLTLTDEMITLQRRRAQAKRSKNFQEADRIRYSEFRDRLNIIVSDTAHGVYFTPAGEG